MCYDIKRYLSKKCVSYNGTVAAWRCAPLDKISSYDTWHNLLSGISQGSFDKIYVKDSNGAMTDILMLVAGAGGTVTSATPPLTINSGVLSLDLSGFCTSASTPLSLTGGQMTIDLTPYSTMDR